MGKTSLVMWLGDYARIYHVPLHEDFYDLYDDNDFDIAVIDEFKGHKTIQWMNAWCNAGVNNLRKKGSQILKKKHTPTIIISNYPLHECYRKACEENREKLDPLVRRLKIVEITEPFNFNKL